MEIAEWNSWFGKAKKNSVLVESYISLEAKDLNNNIKTSNSLNETIDFIPAWQKVNMLVLYRAFVPNRRLPLQAMHHTVEILRSCFKLVRP
jgi:hypothetical protein